MNLKTLSHKTWFSKWSFFAVLYRAVYTELKVKQDPTTSSKNRVLMIDGLFWDQKIYKRSLRKHALVPVERWKRLTTSFFCLPGIWSKPLDLDWIQHKLYEFGRRIFRDAFWASLRRTAGSLVTYKWDKPIGIVQMKRPADVVSFIKRKPDSCEMITLIAWEAEGHMNGRCRILSCNVFFSVSFSLNVDISLSVSWISALTSRRHSSSTGLQKLYRLKTSREAAVRKKMPNACFSALQDYSSNSSSIFKKSEKLCCITTIIMQVHYPTLSTLRAIWCYLQ